MLARGRADFLDFAEQLLFRRVARGLCTDPDILGYRFRNASRRLDARSTSLYGKLGEIAAGAGASAAGVINEGLVFALPRSAVSGDGGNSKCTADGGMGRGFAKTNFPRGVSRIGAGLAQTKWRSGVEN